MAQREGQPAVAVSMGDPLGIGPEIIVKAFAEERRRRSARFVVFGLETCLRLAAERAGIAPFWEAAPDAAGASEGASGVVVVDDARFASCVDLARAGEARPTKEGGEASFRWVEDAVALCREGRARAIITAPISKRAWAMAGRGEFPGHTELLGARFGGERVAMLFDSPGLRVILVTVHTPLTRVPGMLTVEGVASVIEMGDAAVRALGVARPRVAVCGLNPHAGEGGLFGDEEARVITPAIERVRARGVDASGPYPGDTVFNRAIQREFDLVVAMYHDQGLIPVKLLAWDSAVNVTLGLPVVRTSPDHGTAFDIAGLNRADAGSFGRAVDLAVTMATRAP